MKLLIIFSIVAVFIAALLTGVVRRSSQHKSTLISMKGYLPDWWPQKWLNVMIILNIIAFGGAAALVVVSLASHIMNHVGVALIVMFVFSSIFIYLIGLFLGTFLSSEILRKRARKYAGLELPQECF